LEKCGEDPRKTWPDSRWRPVQTESPVAARRHRVSSAHRARQLADARPKVAPWAASAEVAQTPRIGWCNGTRRPGRAPGRGGLHCDAIYEFGRSSASGRRPRHAIPACGLPAQARLHLPGQVGRLRPRLAAGDVGRRGSCRVTPPPPRGALGARWGGHRGAAHLVQVGGLPARGRPRRLVAGGGAEADRLGCGMPCARSAVLTLALTRSPLG
jgi:hypothetical protein